MINDEEVIRKKNDTRSEKKKMEVRSLFEFFLMPIFDWQKVCFWIVDFF